jgi:hypothetical protein
LASSEPSIPSTPIRGAISPSNGRPGRPIDHGRPSSRRASANGCSARELLVGLGGTAHLGIGRDRWSRMQIAVCVKIRWHLVLLGLRQCCAVWDRRRSGERETATLRLGTAHAVGDRPRRTGTGGIRICWDNAPTKNAVPRTVDLQRMSI